MNESLLISCFLFSVLPKELQKRMTTELDKRLDLDLDEVLESPKLKLQLSPAELDKQLLDLYTKISEGPSGDVFRVIGGGANVGRQNLYMKQQARNQSKNGLDRFRIVLALPRDKQVVCGSRIETLPRCSLHIHPLLACRFTNQLTPSRQFVSDLHPQDRRDLLLYHC